MLDRIGTWVLILCPVLLALLDSQQYRAFAWTLGAILALALLTH